MNLLTVMPLQAEGAAEGAMGAASNYSGILMMVLIFVVMYFFMIRPQQKRQKELTKFRQALQKGDKIITAGGIYGKVKNVEDNIATIEIANGVEINIDKSMLLRDSSDMTKQ